MATYQYSAVNQSGTVVRGRIDADGQQDLERRISRLGLSVISSSQVKRSLGGFALFQPKITRDELSQFCFYVERLVAGGVPLLEGLADVRDSVSNATLRNTIGLLITDVEQGGTLSASMRRHPKVFDDIFISLVQAGEHSGDLDTVLRSIGENIRWQDEIIKKTKKAFAYPIFALVVIILASAGLMGFVVPKMVTILESLGEELPPHTIALINTSEFFQNHWQDVIIGIVGAWFGVLVLLKTVPGIDYLMDKLKIRLPLIGPVSEKLLLSRFSNIFGLLYGSGVTVIEGLKISRGALGNKFVAKGLDGVIDSITSGTSLSNAFQNSGLFPPLVLRMIRLGETTGGVDTAMQQIKEYYDRDANEAIDKTQAAIQPLMLLLVAGLLVWIIAAVYGPLYDIVGNVG